MLTCSHNNKGHIKTKQIPTCDNFFYIYKIKKIEQVVASIKEEQDPEIVFKLKRKRRRRIMVEEIQKHNKKPDLFSSLCLWKS